MTSQQGHRGVAKRAGWVMGEGTKSRSAGMPWDGGCGHQHQHPLDIQLVLFPAGCKHVSLLWSYRDKQELYAPGHKHNCDCFFPLCLPIACFQRRKRSRRNSFAGHVSHLSHVLPAIRQEWRPGTPKESPSPPELSPDHISTVRWLCIPHLADPSIMIDQCIDLRWETCRLH